MIPYSHFCCAAAQFFFLFTFVPLPISSNFCTSLCCASPSQLQIISPIYCFKFTSSQVLSVPFARYFHIWGRPYFSVTQVFNGEISIPNCAGHRLLWVIENWVQSYSNLCIHLYSALIHSIHAYFINFIKRTRVMQARQLKPNCGCEELDAQSNHLVRFSAIKS